MTSSKDIVKELNTKQLWTGLFEHLESMAEAMKSRYNMAEALVEQVFGHTTAYCEELRRRFYQSPLNKQADSEAAHERLRKDYRQFRSKIRKPETSSK